MPLEPKQAEERLQDLRRGFESQRDAELSRMARAVSYFMGRHWIRRNSGHDPYNNGFSLNTDYNPDGGRLRVTNNFITSHTQLAEAATRPITVPIDVKPYEHDLDPMSRRQADLVRFIFEREKANMRIDSCAGASNLMKTIMGSWAIGIELHRFETEGVADWALRWFNFPATDIIVDVSRKSPNLVEHDEVAARMIIPIERARTLYGVKIDPQNAKTVGELTTDYQKAYQWSGGQLFKDYAQHSKVKAVEVFQFHRKSAPSRPRFDEMYLFIDDPMDTERGLRLVNEDDIANPFGGCGMPFMLDTYHQLPESHLGQGATGQMIDKQNLANLHETLFERGFATSGHPRWLIDERGCSRERWEQTQQNAGPGSPIFYRGQMTTQNVAPPTAVFTPEPSGQHMSRASDLQEQARQASHRSRLNQGVGKSHVPDVTTQRLLEEGDKVPNLIVEQAARSLGELAKVTIGTVIQAIQAGSPTLLNRLQRHGFTEDDLIAIRRVDPIDYNLNVRIPRDALRPESPFGKMARIRENVEGNNPTITPKEARFMYVYDADMPLSEIDRAAISFCEEMARDVLEEKPFEPVPHIDHDLFQIVFKKAMYALRGRNKRDALNRLARALDSQMQLAEQETAARTQAAQGQPPATGASEPGGMDVSGLMGGASPALALAG